MQLATPKETARGICEQRYRYGDVFKKVMLESLENLFQGKPALFLEASDRADLREEILWICYSSRVLLASPLRSR